MERKPGFTIPKKVKKTSDGNSMISPTKTTDKRPGAQSGQSQSQITSASTNSLLSAKQLEPVQVHSVGQQSKQQQKPPQAAVIQSVSVKTLLSSPSSSSTKTSQLADEIRYGRILLLNISICCFEVDR